MGFEDENLKAKVVLAADYVQPWVRSVPQHKQIVRIDTAHLTRRYGIVPTRIIEFSSSHQNRLVVSPGVSGESQVRLCWAAVPPS